MNSAVRERAALVFPGRLTAGQTPRRSEKPAAPVRVQQVVRAWYPDPYLLPPDRRRTIDYTRLPQSCQHVS